MAIDKVKLPDNSVEEVHAIRIKETTLEDEEFTYQATPVHDIADAYRIDRIKGRTLAWNQLAGDFESSNFWAVNYGSISNGRYDSGSVPSGAYGLATTDWNVFGHIYILSFDITNDSTVLAWVGGINSDIGPNSSRVRKSFRLAPSAGNSRPLIGFNCDVEGSTYNIGNICLFDLTLMFGAGNEPSTVAEFEAMFPLPYYGYNEGELISVAAEGIETVGFNLWDEEWGFGYWNTGTGSRSYYSGEYCTENPIRVFAGKTYFVKNAVNNYVIFYDKDMNYLSDAAYELTFTPPAGSAYAQINFGAFPGSYNHDICVNLSDASRNGQYEPHWSKVLPLGLDAIKVKDSQGNIITVNGLASAGDVRDEIRDGKYIKRVGRVDLGTLTWGYNQAGHFYTAPLSGAIEGTYWWEPCPGICSRYTPDGCFYLYNETAGHDKIFSFGMESDTSLRVRDSAYSDATAFTAAMSGVYLYYELEAPVEYDLVAPMPFSGEIDGYGTMRVISDNIVAPFNGDITYGCNPGQIAADSNALMEYVNSVFDLRYYETSEPSGGMLPNREYQLGTLSGNTTFTLAAGTSGVTNHYFWSFDTGSTAPTITWPSGITSWYGGSAPTINASKHYEVSVLNGVAVVMEV